MGLMDLLKKKKSRAEIIVDVDTEFRRLSDKYDSIIFREVRALKGNRLRKEEDNPRSVLRLKTAYYGLGIVKQAQDNLREIRTDQQLVDTINGTSAALRTLNRIAGQTPQVNTWLLNYRVDTMNEHAQQRGDGMKNVYSEPIDTLVNNDIVDRLVKGESVESCLRGQHNFLVTTAPEDLSGLIDALPDDGDLESMHERIQALTDQL